MKSNPKKAGLSSTFGTESTIVSERKINKNSRLPAYAQMADLLREGISQGEHPPGGRLPSESALARTHEVSNMTARQAISVLEEEGLVHRVQGKGTFVRKINVTASSFSLESLSDVLSDREHTSVQVIKAGVKKEPGMEKEVLGLEPNQPVIKIERIILYNDEPFTLHVSYTRFDPKSPTVEAMLDTVLLTGLMFQEEYSNFKKGTLRLLPANLTEREAHYLKMAVGENVFKLEHLFFDFNDRPAALGWFIVGHEKMPLISKIGVWND